MSHPIMFDDDDPVLARVRGVCLGFPEAQERVGSPFDGEIEGPIGTADGLCQQLMPCGRRNEEPEEHPCQRLLRVGVTHAAVHAAASRAGRNDASSQGGGALLGNRSPPAPMADQPSEQSQEPQRLENPRPQ